MNSLIKRREHEESLMITNFSSVTAEALQKLQTNIQFAGLDTPIKVIGITSSVESEGKSTLTANLANTYAFRGAKVLIINLDLRRPTIHHFYDVPNKIGITDYVASNDITAEQLVVHLKNGVDLINAGTRTPYSTKVLASKKIPELIEKLKPDYDYILVDTAPVLLVADAMICSHYIDGFLVVCTQGYTKKKELANCINSMKNNNVNIIGVVMTEVKDFSQVGSGKEAYHYYYGTGSKSKK